MTIQNPNMLQHGPAATDMHLQGFELGCTVSDSCLAAANLPTIAMKDFSTPHTPGPWALALMLIAW
jgi:hypothetical protein